MGLHARDAMLGCHAGSPWEVLGPPWDAVLGLHALYAFLGVLGYSATLQHAVACDCHS